MISSLGHVLLVMVVLANGLATLPFGEKKKFIIYLVASIIPVFSFGLLEYAFLISDFSVKNVFLNSSTLLPTIYKISAAWSSHEGSMLLWFSMLSLVGVFCIKKLSPLVNFKPSLISDLINIAAFVQLLFAIFITYSSNPFEFLNISVMNQGLGLNPMLQDKALSIHPPILYLGYVSLYGVFLSSLSFLIYSGYCSIRLDRVRSSQSNLTNTGIDESNLDTFVFDESYLLKLYRFFVTLSLAALTAGIGLGAWWAYRELGWGGYWFFDPVENISLLPWIISIASYHSLIIAIRIGKLKKISILFGILSFLITLYGFSLVRGGIINSIHSFSFSSERGVYMISISAIITVISIYFYLTKSRYLSNYSSSSSNRYSTDTSAEINHNRAKPYYNFILMGNILWILAAMVLIIAIVYPIYYQLIFKIDISIDPNYFHKIFIPIFIPVMILAGIAPILSKNIKNKFTEEKSEFTNPHKSNYILLNRLLRKLYLSLVLILSIPIILHIITSSVFDSILFYIITPVIVFCSIFLMVSSLELFAKSLVYFPIKKLKSKDISLFLGHFGVGLLGLSIAINVSLSSEIEFFGTIGDDQINNDIEVKLSKIKFADSKAYYRQIVDFNIKDKHDNSITLKPENRLYKVENSLSQEVDIFSFITHDLYAVLSRVEKDSVAASIQYKPMISFVWLSLSMLSLSFWILLEGCWRSLKIRVDL